MGMFDFLKSKKSTAHSDTSKPNILIILPIYHLLNGDEPFGEIANNYDSPQLNCLSVYTTLYKIFCYNRLLENKFGKDIYRSTITEKQRERLAANGLEISEQFVVLLRMFDQLAELGRHEKDFDLESAIAIAMIKKEPEFSHIKDDEELRVQWTVQIIDLLNKEKLVIQSFFENCWKNAGFSEDELKMWLKQG